MKIATYTYDFVPGASQADLFKTIRDAGFDGIQVRGQETEADAECIAKNAQVTGLEVAGVMGRLGWSKPLSDPDPEVRNAGMDGLRMDIKTAQICGADDVLVIPGVVNEKVTYDECWERSREALQEVLPDAEKAGVVLSVENVWNKFLLSPPEMIRYVDSFGSPYLKVYFDVGNFVLFGMSDQWILALGDRVHQVHLKDFDRNTRGFPTLFQGDVPWVGVMQALRQIGYDRWLVAEVGPYRQFPQIGLKDLAGQLRFLVEEVGV